MCLARGKNETNLRNGEDRAVRASSGGPLWILTAFPPHPLARVSVEKPGVRIV